jgi:predicted O-methyltransferase YrrM
MEHPWDSWYEGGDFTTDWASRAFPVWQRELDFPKDHTLNILEVGAWEGRSTLFFLNFFPKSVITSVDLFTFGNDARFDMNVMAKHADRVTKVVGRSLRVLDRLATSRTMSFDLIYIDGSHDRDDVIIDSILAWRLLRVGGIMVWDDYGLLSAMPEHFNRHQDPKPAIDVFLQWHLEEARVIHRDYQMLVRKIREHHPVCLDDPGSLSVLD